VTREREQAKPIELSLVLEPRGGSRRGSIAVGDVLRAMVHGGRHQAIWVYLGDRDLVAACPDNAQCDSSNSGLTLELRVPARGHYSIIGLTSADPIMAPHAVLDLGLTAAKAVGARFEVRLVDVN